MKLNKLNYQIIEEKDEFLPNLWFELLIDDEPIEKLTSGEKAIPHYYFENDENDLPSFINYENKKLHLLGVCTCGESGCGSTKCEIEKDENFVNIKVFFYDGGYKPPKDIKFRFSRKNYDSVISEIKRRTKEYNEVIESK